MDVLISGASIAGPALAYWLERYGFRPTVVEIAPALRTGGNSVDYRGPTHLGVLARMGDVLPRMRAEQTGGTAMTFIDADGRTLMEWPSDLAGGDLELQRGDLARILCEAGGSTEYRFGDSITAMTETRDGVDVTFASGLQRTYALVIGADGVHSRVRRLIFGPPERYVKHLGYYVGGWDVPNRWGWDHNTRLYNEPGRMVSVAGDRHDPARAHAFIAFASPELTYDRHDDAARRQIITDRYAGMGGLAPAVLEALPTAGDLWFDQICRVDIDTWYRGRVALIGDAACGATIGGQGNGTATIAAYVLAGELARARGDHTVAFPRYQERLARFAKGTQKGGNTAGRFLAPKTATGIRLRNAIHNQKWFMDLTFKIAGDRSTNIDLPEYVSPASPRPPR
jgi:2-polyprenyl-6-methoxyphenol hydroxylase-like FAD-dependent oxidoreductase